MIRISPSAEVGMKAISGGLLNLARIQEPSSLKESATFSIRYRVRGVDSTQVNNGRPRVTRSKEQFDGKSGTTLRPEWLRLLCLGKLIQSNNRSNGALSYHPEAGMKSQRVIHPSG